MTLPRFLGTALLACLLSLPAFGHSVDHALEGAATSPARGARLETVEGRIHRVIIDDRIADVVIEVVSLQLDDGRAVKLNGDDVAALSTGDRVQVQGRRNGKALFAETVYVLVPAGAHATAPKRGSVALEGTLALLHADFFEEQRSEFVFELHDDAGHATTLELPTPPEALHKGMHVRVSGQPGSAGTAVVPDTITITSLGATKAKTILEKASRTTSVLVILMTFT
ncbi:MAG: hypothetical protein M3Z31_19200, partial [Pseudomonadota bacterium]|nr:hypothetical protein [Pseudomonadota bacterium]